jgi:hypothetical protein
MNNNQVKNMFGTRKPANILTHEQQLENAKALEKYFAIKSLKAYFHMRSLDPITSKSGKIAQATHRLRIEEAKFWNFNF